jgi:hypothetical protein
VIRITDTSEEPSRELAVNEWKKRLRSFGVDWNELVGKNIWWSSCDKVWKLSAQKQNG